MGRPGNKQPVTDMGEHAGKQAKGRAPELPNTIFMVAICGVLNGSNDPRSSLQLEPSFTDVRQWEDLIDFIEKNGGPKDPYCLTA